MRNFRKNSENKISENSITSRIVEILTAAAFPLIGAVIPLIVHIVSFKPVLTEEIAGKILSPGFPLKLFLKGDYTHWQGALLKSSVLVLAAFAIIYIILGCVICILAVPRLPIKSNPAIKKYVIPAGIALAGAMIGYFAIAGNYDRNYSASSLPLIPQKPLTDLAPSLEPICEEIERNSEESAGSVLTTAEITNALTVVSNGKVKGIMIESPDAADIDTNTFDETETVYAVYDAATIESFKNSLRLRFAEKAVETADLSLYSYETISFLTDDALLSDLSKLEGKKYTAYLVSMYDISEFDPAIIKRYTLWETFLSGRCMDKNDSLICLEKYNDIIFRSQKTEYYYFGADPELMWELCGKDDSAFEDYIDETINFPALANPEVNFELLIPGYSVSRPTTEEDADRILYIYEKFAANLESAANLHINYYGAEKWLCVNPYLFAEGSDVHLNDDIMDDVIKELLQGLYQTDSKDLVSKVSDYLKAALSYTENPPETYNLENTTVVILGDSIFDHNRGSSNAGTALSNLSGASVINLAIGGASASKCIYEDENPDEYSDILKYQLSDADSLDTQIKEAGNDKLVFIIEFGLNDYFGAFSVSNPEDPFDEYTYSGAIRSGMDRIKKAYPGSTIVVMIPGIISFADYGIAPFQEGGQPLQSYRDAIKDTAESSGAYVFDITAELGETEENINEFLQDGVHFNRYGRFVLGRELARFLDGIDK